MNELFLQTANDQNCDMWRERRRSSVSEKTQVEWNIAANGIVLMMSCPTRLCLSRGCYISYHVIWTTFCDPALQSPNGPVIWNQQSNHRVDLWKKKKSIYSFIEVWLTLLKKKKRRRCKSLVTASRSSAALLRLLGGDNTRASYPECRTMRKGNGNKSLNSAN